MGKVRPAGWPQHSYDFSAARGLSTQKLAKTVEHSITGNVLGLLQSSWSDARELS